MTDYEVLFGALIQTVLAAGRLVMDIYSGDFSIEYKSDNSPLTQADTGADALIRSALAGIEADGEILPVVSEEGRPVPYSTRRSWQSFWLVDPLDGTREFVKRNGEFTVNIALIKDRLPAAGVVYAPAKGLLYWGGLAAGAYRARVDGGIVSNTERLPLETASGRSEFVAAGSRSHRDPGFDDYVAARAAAAGKSGFRVITAGSSLKFGLAAEGSVDIFPRFGRTMEWDTAAGHAVAAGAGALCCSIDGGRELEYNKPEMVNGGFVVYR